MADKYHSDLDAPTYNIFQTLRVGDNYLFSPLIASNYENTNVALPVDTLFAVLYPVVRAVTFDRIAVRSRLAGAAGAKARLGIYNVGTNLYPGTLVVDAGEIATDNTDVNAIIINEQLGPGLYFLALVTNEGTWKISCASAFLPLLGEARPSHNTCGWSVAYGYAALPDPFPAGGSLISDLYHIALRPASLD